jgi:hypothetical protein
VNFKANQSKYEDIIGEMKCRIKKNEDDVVIAPVLEEKIYKGEEKGEVYYCENWLPSKFHNQVQYNALGLTVMTRCAKVLL